MNNLNNGGLQESVKIVAPSKRPSILDNIRERLGGNYNLAKHFKKNEKNLREKVRFFQKREAAGELKPDMARRFEEARELLKRVQDLNPEEANPLEPYIPPLVAAPPPLVAAPPPLVAAPPPLVDAPSPLVAAPSPLFPPTPYSSPVNALPPENPLLRSMINQSLYKAFPDAKNRSSKMKLKKGRTAKFTSDFPSNNVSAGFNPPPANKVPAQPLTYGHYSPGGTYHVDGNVNPLPYGNNSPQVVDLNKFRLNRVKQPSKSRRSRTVKRRKLIHPEDFPYYEKAVAEIEVPPLYHPLTGQLIISEDAIDVYKDAINMLEGLIDKAVNRAYTLKKRNKKNIKPKAGL